jgi:hypothetical protein
MERIIYAARTPWSAESTLVMAPVVPRRSARRATAHRASTRRATARERHDDIEGRVIDYLRDHPRSTTGDIAKGLNANRGTIAAGVSHLVRGREVTKAATGYAAKPKPTPSATTSARRSA